MRRVVAWSAALIVTAACSSALDPIRSKQDAVPVSAGPVLESREGRASFVARTLHGRQTASGVAFDGTAMVAAHPRYPFGTRLRVTHLENGREVTVRVVDRGPARGPQSEGVVIDLSRAAAEVLGFVDDGRARVRIDVLEWGKPDRTDSN